MEKIIVVEKSEVLQGTKGDYLKVTDKEGKTQNIFDQALWNLFGDGLAVKLTLEKQGKWWNVVGAEAVAAELAQQVKETQTTAAEEKQASIEGQCGLKVIAKLIIEKEGFEKDHGELCKIFYLKLYEVMDAFYYGGVNEPDKKPIQQADTGLDTRVREDDSRRGDEPPEFENPGQWLKWAVLQTKKTPSQLKEECGITEKSTPEQLREAAIKLIKGE